MILARITGIEYGDSEDEEEDYEEEELNLQKLEEIPDGWRNLGDVGPNGDPG